MVFYCLICSFCHKNTRGCFIAIVSPHDMIMLLINDSAVGLKGYVTKFDLFTCYQVSHNVMHFSLLKFKILDFTSLFVHQVSITLHR